MPIIAVGSGGGAPGVSTLSLGMALSWPRPVVLVEADPTGGSGILAGYFRGGRDDEGLVELAAAAQQGRLAARLPELLIEVPGTSARVLVGSRSHEQAVGLVSLWGELLVELRSLAATGQDVIVDVGRFGLDGAPWPLVAGADLALLVVRSSLPALTAAASWARVLVRQSAAGQAVATVVVGPGRPYSAAEVQAALGLPVIAAVAWSAEDARVLSEGAAFPAASFWRRVASRDADRRMFEAAPWMRSVRATGEAARAQLPAAAVDAVAAGPVRVRSSLFDRSDA